MSEPQFLRKTAQEVEIDRLLAEEFACDPGFCTRFLAACGIEAPGFRVDSVVAEPSLGGQGFGDLLVAGQAGMGRVALLIEDKVTAGAAPRQAERYARHAVRLRADGWDGVWTVLVAPARYRGERAAYDATLSIEQLAGLLENPDPARLAFRRGILLRAVEKAASSGVKVADTAVHAFKRHHLDALSRLAAERGLPLGLPGLRAEYYDNDSWIENIRSAGLPPDAVLRHRCWLSAQPVPGMVDLIIRRTGGDMAARLQAQAPPGATVSGFSKGKGWQLSVPVPEMRPGRPYDMNAAAVVVEAICTLTAVAGRLGL